MIRMRTVANTIASGAIAVLAYAGAVQLLGGTGASAQSEPVAPPVLSIDPQVLARVDDFAVVMREVGRLMEPSVVQIDVIKMADGRAVSPRTRPRAQDDSEDAPLIRGEGSGVIMEVRGDTGYILTNNHVAGGASEMLITLADGRRIIDAKLVGADSKTDLAVVQISAPNLVPARWGDSEKLQRGDVVMAFGSPFGYVGSMSQGIVSGLNRQTNMLGRLGYEYFIQTDAVINPGNSGGPLVNTRGEVVGINAAIATRNGVFNGIGFAIPSSQAHFVFDQIRDTGKVVRGYLGVEIADASQVMPGHLERIGFAEGRRGVYVSDVTAGAPAAGRLQSGDVIIGIDGRPVGSTQELRLRIAAQKPGSTVRLEVWRDRSTTQVDVELGEQPEEVQMAARPPRLDGGEALSTLGLRLGDLTDEQRTAVDLPADQGGAVVRSLQRRSIAAQAGLRVGDVVLKIGDEAIADADAARDLLAKADLEAGVTLYVRNQAGDSSIFLQIK